MEKLRDWFGFPAAAVKSLGWLMRASVVVSIALGAVLIAIAALRA